MKKIIYILTSLALMALSCEKPIPRGEYGNPLIRLYGDAFADIGNSIVASDRGYVICGSVTIMDRIENEAGNREIVMGSEHLDMGVIFTDRDGIMITELNIGTPGLDDTGRRIIHHDGYYYCLGTATVDRGSGSDKDVIVVKITESGQVEAQWYFGGPYDQEGYDIIPNNDNTGFVICGSSVTNLSGNLEMKLWEISYNGTLIKQETSYDFEGDDAIYRIINNGGQGYIITGTTYQLPGSGVAEIRNMFIAKTNDELLGTDFTIYALDKNLLPADIEILDDGGLLIVGKGESAGEYNGFLIKLGPPVTSYALTDYSVYFSAAYGSYNSILNLSDGQTYVIGGSIDNSQGNLASSENIFLFLDSDMNTVREPYISGGIGRQYINDLIGESDGKIVATGSNGDDIRSLITLFKFDPWD